jgi:hypothetical protein
MPTPSLFQVSFCGSFLAAPTSVVWLRAWRVRYHHLVGKPAAFFPHRINRQHISTFEAGCQFLRAPQVITQTVRDWRRENSALPVDRKCFAQLVPLGVRSFRDAGNRSVAGVIVIVLAPTSIRCSPANMLGWGLSLENAPCEGVFGIVMMPTSVPVSCGSRRNRADRD